MDWDGSWGFAGWLMMTLMMLLVWGVPVGLVVWLIRSNFNRDHATRAPQPGTDADQMLAERYARGEIDEEEFRRRREVLRAGLGGVP